MEMPTHQEIVVGARGFEPPTSRTQTVRANQAALRPELVQLYLISRFRQGAHESR